MILGPDHIVLFCTDTEACRAFYEAVGFRWLRGWDGMHFFAFGSSELMLHPCATRPNEACTQLYARTPDLDGLFAHCQQAGLRPVHHQSDAPLTAPHTTPWGSREFELSDPEGHRWGFVQPERGE